MRKKEAHGPWGSPEYDSPYTVPELFYFPTRMVKACWANGEHTLSEWRVHAEWNLLSTYVLMLSKLYRAQMRAQRKGEGTMMWILCEHKINNLFGVPRDCVSLVIRKKLPINCMNVLLSALILDNVEMAIISKGPA